MKSMGDQLFLVVEGDHSSGTEDDPEAEATSRGRGVWPEPVRTRCRPARLRRATHSRGESCYQKGLTASPKLELRVAAIPGYRLPRDRSGCAHRPSGAFSRRTGERKRHELREAVLPTFDQDLDAGLRRLHPLAPGSQAGATSHGVARTDHLDRVSAAGAAAGRAEPGRLIGQSSTLAPQEAPFPARTTSRRRTVASLSKVSSGQQVGGKAGRRGRGVALASTNCGRRIANLIERSSQP